MNENTESVEIFKALSDDTRYKIFLVMARSGERLCVNDIVKKLGISQPAVSQHLKILKSAGLADSSRVGHKIQYSINRDFVMRTLKKISLLVQPADQHGKELIADAQ